MNGFMQDTDAFAWNLEKDPTLRATIVGVAWLEHSPDWEHFVAKVDRAANLIPMFRQCVVEPPGRLAAPRNDPRGTPRAKRAPLTRPATTHACACL